MSEVGQFIPKNIVVSYGGGVNSVALLCWLAQQAYAPRVRAIVMANPGSERRGTVRILNEVLPDFLRKHGMPQLTLVDRVTEGAFRPRAWRLETLEEECLRIGSLPSVAYGFKKCSAKYKAEPQRWWLERQPWATALWARGEKLTRTLGYDAGESRRVKKGIHVIVAAVFIGPRPPGKQVAHWNGDKNDNRLANLRYATREENDADSARLGERPWRNGRWVKRAEADRIEAGGEIPR